MRRHKIFALMLLLLEWQQKREEETTTMRVEEKGSISWLFPPTTPIPGYKTTLQSNVCRVRMRRKNSQRGERRLEGRKRRAEEECKFFIWTHRRTTLKSTNSSRSLSLTFPPFPISIIENKFHSSFWSCVTCFLFVDDPRNVWYARRAQCVREKVRIFAIK